LFLWPYSVLPPPPSRLADSSVRKTATGDVWPTSPTRTTRRSINQQDNFGKLEVAWRFKADRARPRPEYNWESTPLEATA